MFHVVGALSTPPTISGIPRYAPLGHLVLICNLQSPGNALSRELLFTDFNTSLFTDFKGTMRMMSWLSRSLKVDVLDQLLTEATA